MQEGGNTIAVLGTGIDIVYPKENNELYEKLSKNALILSEYTFNTRPQASNFPRRNRIVSGLSKGVLVVEASVKSGSLITAHQALEQGRDIYAIPGSPFDNKTSGCNKLLKDGAILVESSEDILNNFYFEDKVFESFKLEKTETKDLFEYSLDNNKINSDIATNNIDDDSQKLLSLLSTAGEDIDDIIRSLSLEPQVVLMMIMELELDGKIIRLPGNKIAKA